MFSKYFGDTVVKCKISCDVCQSKDIVEERNLKSLRHLNIYKNDFFKNKNTLARNSFIDILSNCSRVKKFQPILSWDFSAETILKNICKIKF